MKNICIIGEILVDVCLKNSSSPLKMRLGGIIHISRALWAFSTKYSLAYISPQYLIPKIQEYLSHFDKPESFLVAKTLNSPNIILIEEKKEVGDQGYELLLRENIEYDYTTELVYNSFDNIFITAGQYDLLRILLSLKGKNVSIELANISLQELKKINFFFKNIYISTSSLIFKSFIQSNDKFNYNDFIQLFKPYCECLIFKENRGGTRLYNFKEEKLYQVPSHTRPIQHSVGVGDVFNITYEIGLYENTLENLSLASFVALEYASTTYPQDLKKSVERLLNTDIGNLVSIEGTVLNWEQRQAINIYIAAPDFDFVNTELIDQLAQSLLYHNFMPRRPVRENGQMQESDSAQEKLGYYQKDHEILNECQIMIAVLLYNDPGTLVEIGIASERKMPILLYDPYNIATNCMLTHSCELVTNNLDEIISETFNISSKICKHSI